jgi:hypothetical protein
MKKARFRRGKTFPRKKIFFGGIFIVVCTVGVFIALPYLPFGKNYAFISPVPLAYLSARMSAPTSKTKETESLLKRANIQYAAVQDTKEAIVITLSSGEKVLISKEKSLAVEISSLQLILQRLTIEGKKFASLDFRFDKPLIVLR